METLQQSYEQRASSKQLEELVAMLKEEKGLSRLFSTFYEKYRSYGRVENTISVKLENLTPIEKKAIQGFFGIDFGKTYSVTVSANKFEKTLLKTRFKGVLDTYSFENILERYFGSLQTKEEEYEDFLNSRDKFFQEFKDNHQPELMREIIHWAERKGNEQNRLYARFKQDEYNLSEDLKVVAELVSHFPLLEPMYLPIFAAKVTKDPHAFDIDKTEKGRFLIYILQVIQDIEIGTPIKASMNAEEKNELLVKYNLMKDDLSNYVTVCNVEAIDEKGAENTFLKLATSEHISMNLPLKEVLKLHKVTTHSNQLFVVENSSVASRLMNHSFETGIHYSIVCGNGVMNLATIQFLDKFVKGGGVLHYSGDFDPEGLLMAQRLLDRYGDVHVKTWMFSEDMYVNSLSNIEINDVRLKKLNSVTNENLIAVKDMMLEVKKAGYQENYLDEFLRLLSQY